ncbi:hypothetical protein HY642_05945 [Candidatus Woesearchaeota archaeon]|nr:hypothetical protein [Candidatus Woesearchaeota archaeon]
MGFQAAPLSSSFMVASMVGFLISVLFIPKVLDNTWAFTFGIVFTAMFAASFLSMTRADPDPQLYPRPARRR